MSGEVLIGGRVVGPGRPTLIVAEAGVNHNGDPALARRLVQAAAEAGVDAVKFQTFRAERLTSPAAPKAGYQIETTDPHETQFEMLRRLELSVEAHRELRTECEKHGVMFLSTPFDEASADLLHSLDASAFKLGSGEITNRLLLERVGCMGRPVILSTGMSYLGEVEGALRILAESGCREVVLLHCVSNYPTDPANVNLRAMETMARAFGVPVGFSDHTPGLETALAAVALGACVIEKHFTIDRNLPGPDHRSSLEPVELRRLVTGIRLVEAALGDGVKRPAPAEADNRRVIRRSLAAAADLPSGAVLTRDVLRALRPATGISPLLLDAVVGRRLKRPLRADDIIVWDALE